MSATSSFGIEYDRTIYQCDMCRSPEAPYCVVKTSHTGKRSRSVAGWCLDCIPTVLRLEHHLHTWESLDPPC